MMKLRILLVIFLAFGVTACGLNGSGSSDENSGGGLTPEELEGGLSDFGGGGLSNNLPGIAVNPSPQFASLPPSVVETPITPVPDIRVGTQEALRASAGDRVFFQTNSVQLDGRAQAILREVSNWMKNNQGRNLVIEGHADERGTREYNLALGNRRAQAVKSYLVAQGVPSTRMSVISFGKERPAAGSSHPRSWALNRRAVFIVR